MQLPFRRSLVKKHDNSKVSTEPEAHARPKSAPSRSFKYLSALPFELQVHVLSFLPIKTLCKGLARANKEWHSLADEYIRHCLLRYLDADSEGAKEGVKRHRLFFEAQRPIDTLCHKHELQFSHFGVTNSVPGGAFSTVANFSFQRDQRKEFQQTSTQSRDDGQAAAMVRGVPPHLVGRLREEHHSSSVLQQTEPSRSTGQSTESSAAVDDFTQGLDAYDWAAVPPTSLPSPPTSSTTEDTRVEQTTENPKRAMSPVPVYKMQLDPLDSFETWILNLTLEADRPLFCRSKNANAGAQAARFSRRHARKRVAEGLDRVYRDWFYCHPAKQEEGNAGELPPQTCHDMWHTVTPELLSTFGAVNVGGPRRHDSSAPRSHDGPLPNLRSLEIDDASCSVAVQPHAIPMFNGDNTSAGSSSCPTTLGSSWPNIHPALLNTYSHAYLSGTSLSLQESISGGSTHRVSGYAGAPSHASRIEVTFEVQHVRIYAGRLLKAFEEAADEQYEREEQHQQQQVRGAHDARQGLGGWGSRSSGIVIGGYGGAAWAGVEPSEAAEDTIRDARIGSSLAASTTPTFLT